MSELSKNTILYMPENGNVNGVIQIIHGMAEYQGRYRELAQFLTQNGYAVITSDLKGHGNNIARESDLGFFGDNAVSRLVGDAHEITNYIRDHFPGKPVFLFGHGIGALIACIYTKKYDNFLSGLFLSGMPADKTLRFAANLLVMLFTAMRGEYHRSSLINYLIMGQYYRPYAGEGSEFAWLSADPDNVVKYEINPKCGFIYTLNGFKTILDLMNRTYTKGSWIRKTPELPIRLFWGNDDTCIAGRNDLTSVVHLFTDNGYTDVGYITYPGQRHEVFQDYRRDLVYNDLLRELDSICLADADRQEPVKKTSKHIVLENFIDPEVDKPLVKDERLNLQEFIDAHKAESGKTEQESHPKVEMIDFADIESMISESFSMETLEPKPSPAPVSEEAPDADISEPAPEVTSDTEPSETAPKVIRDDETESSVETESDAEQKSSTETEPEFKSVSNSNPAPVIKMIPVTKPVAMPEEETVHPLDSFDGFKIDPNITDGLIDPKE